MTQPFCPPLVFPLFTFSSLFVALVRPSLVAGDQWIAELKVATRSLITVYGCGHVFRLDQVGESLVHDGVHGFHDHGNACDLYRVGSHEDQLFRRV